MTGFGKANCGTGDKVSDDSAIKLVDEGSKVTVRQALLCKDHATTASTYAVSNNSLVSPLNKPSFHLFLAVTFPTTLLLLLLTNDRPRRINIAYYVYTCYCPNSANNLLRSILITMGT